MLLGSRPRTNRRAVLILWICCRFYFKLCVWCYVVCVFILVFLFILCLGHCSSSLKVNKQSMALTRVNPHPRPSVYLHILMKPQQRPQYSKSLSRCFYCSDNINCNPDTTIWRALFQNALCTLPENELAMPSSNIVLWLRAFHMCTYATKSYFPKRIKRQSKNRVSNGNVKFGDHVLEKSSS